MSTSIRVSFLRTGLMAIGLSTSVISAQKAVDWPAYGGQREFDHYSQLTQINRKNVNQLKQAWTYDTGEKGDIQTNPVIVGRTLYAFPRVGTELGAAEAARRLAPAAERDAGQVVFSSDNEGSGEVAALPSADRPKLPS